MAVAQSAPENKVFLLARRRVQALASRLLCLQVLAVVLLPSTFALVSVFRPDLRLFASGSSILLAIVDIVLIDRLQKSLLSDSAKLQEEFDCQVFEQSWNYYICGSRPNALIIDRRSQVFLKRHGDKSIIDWYPSVISTVPIDVGQLIAQQVNIDYDFRVRSNYRLVLFLVLVLLFSIIAFSLWDGLISLSSILTAVIVPFFPVVNWCSRESYRQYDALKKLKIVRDNLKSAWKRLSPDFDVDEVDFITRQVQSANYVRRSSSPVVFDKIYWFKRAGHEQDMIAQAESLVREVSVSVKSYSSAKEY